MGDAPPYTGLLTAMVTPFGPDGRIDEDVAVSLGRHLLATGSDGLVLGATTGEPSTQTSEERIALLATLAGELEDHGALIAGAGSNDTRQACLLTERAVEAGMNAVLSVTPCFNQPSRRGLLRHYQEVAAAAGGRPVILYNIRDRTRLNIPPELLAELAQIEGIEAVKQSNPLELQAVDGLAVLAGNDDLLTRSLAMRGAGGICVSSHLAGEEMRRLFDEPEHRAEIDRGLAELYRVLFITTNPAPIKAALKLLGLDVGDPRLPLVPVDEAELAQIETVLGRYDLLGH